MTVAGARSAGTTSAPLLLALTLLLAGCGAADDPERAEAPRSDGAGHEHTLRGDTMGTRYTVKLVGPSNTFDAAVLTREVNAALDAIVAALSTYEPASDISRFNRSRSTTWLPTSYRLCTAVEEATRISRRLDGAFDITVGPLVALWGFGPGPRRDAPPSPERVADTLAAVGHEKLRADCERPALRKDRPDLAIDLSAYAKGLAVDTVADVLAARGLSRYLVEIGGELRLAGRNARGEPWAIAVERPVAGRRTIQAVLRLTDVAVATSGDYRNFFEREGRRYAHIIDPRTGAPVAHTTGAVTVLADRAAEADALATGLLVLGAEAGLAFAEREGVAALFLVREDGHIVERMSAGFARLLAAAAVPPRPGPRAQ